MVNNTIAYATPVSCVLEASGVDHSASAPELLILAALLLAGRAAARGRDFETGLWLGLGIMKPQLGGLVAFGLFLRARRRHRLLLGTAVIGCGQFLPWALGLRDQRTVAELLDPIDPAPLLHSSMRIPAARGCTSLFLPLAILPPSRIFTARWTWLPLVSTFSRWASVVPMGPPLRRHSFRARSPPFSRAS